MSSINGQKFGKLTVISEQYRRWSGKYWYHYVMTSCECGKGKEVTRNSLVMGHTKSCGCIKRPGNTKKKGSLLENGIKKCSKCLKSYSKDWFYSGKNFQDGLTVWCKWCYSRDTYKRKFNLDDFQIDFLFGSENIVCEICDIFISPFGENIINVDHDHKTGKVRGVLCSLCNMGLRKSITPSVIDSAIKYLKLDGAYDIKEISDHQNYFYFSGSDYAKRKFKYGCDKQTFNKLLNLKNGCCYICSNKFKNNKDICLDHCHNSKKIRGVLCQDCNSLLGYMKDDISRLKSAKKFLLYPSKYPILSQDSPEP